MNNDLAYGRGTPNSSFFLPNFMDREMNLEGKLPKSVWLIGLSSGREAWPRSKTGE